MNRRLHHAITQASEFRAAIVLGVVMTRRAWRILQDFYSSLPSIIELVEYQRRWFNVKLAYFMYKEFHWI